MSLVHQGFSFQVSPKPVPRPRPDSGVCRADVQMELCPFTSVERVGCLCVPHHSDILHGAIFINSNHEIGVRWAGPIPQPEAGCFQAEDVVCGPYECISGTRGLRVNPCSPGPCSYGNKQGSSSLPVQSGPDSLNRHMLSTF